MRRRRYALTALTLVLVAGCSIPGVTDDGDEPTVETAGAGGARGDDEAPSTDDPEEPTTTQSEEPTTEPADTGLQPEPTGPVDVDPTLGANPMFLGTGYTPVAVDCALPAWSLDPDAAQAYYAAAIECHHQSWAPVFTEAGGQLAAPSLWAGAIGAEYDGACGSNTTGREAFYCAGDTTIAMPFDSMSSIAQHGEGYALAVLSHEYGHHLQQQMGITLGYWAHGEAVGWESDAGQLLSRQFELQAWCLSGMFYGTNVGSGAITSGLYEQAYDNNSHAGDRSGELRLHGTNANIASWFGWGYHPSADPAADVAPTTYECNPWAAREASTLE